MYGSSGSAQKHMIYPVGAGGGQVLGFVPARDWIYERSQAASRRYGVDPNMVNESRNGYRRLDMLLAKCGSLQWDFSRGRRRRRSLGIELFTEGQVVLVRTKYEN